jgi:hypothetical protein
MKSETKIRMLTLLLSAAAVDQLACTRGPKGLSSTAYIATERAVDALQRVYDYRDERRELFEPRLLDAQKAVAEIPRAEPTGWTGKLNPDWQVRLRAETCLNILERHRINLDLIYLAYAKVERKGQSASNDLQYARAERDKSASNLGKCIEDVRAYVQLNATRP